MFVIEDEIHAEHHGQFGSFDDALAELRRRAKIPWDEAPNAAPCTSWRACERKYFIVEFDDSSSPSKVLQRVAVLKVSASGVEWSSRFEDGGHDSG